MNLLLDLQARHAWRGALVAASLNAIGMPLDVVLARKLPDMPSWPPLVSSAVGMVLIGVLLANRSRSTVRLASMVFLVNNAVIIATLWITSGYYAAAAGALGAVPGQQARRARGGAARPRIVGRAGEHRGFCGLDDWQNT